MTINSSSRLTAIVLAGGKSSRMGQDKALIPVQGVPLLQRVCSIAHSCADIVYVVTPWPERYQDLLLPGCEFIREVPLSGESLAHGPLVGFAQGLAEVQTDWVVLLACDLPRLRVEVLQDWVTRLDSVGDNAIAALAEHPKGWEPLCGFYRRRCLPQLLEFINKGGRSFQQWLQQHPVEVLPLAEPEMLFNCNTPEDLALS
ncbi:MAG: molybdenum cofactor guanylyltransferase [Nostoc sp. CmiVER01]|uniref:molybdenum cofactor guanylyltransferase n=1 Tax=Nostoc sp. CmiVER01 TaxID=3075384 RepID=UPI002AD5AAD5|nr:molybdenum cofactor guanylyltransferase [Nostoc sp. CmiVER01]MDZ8122760.1 molybdenum cofactor guanylyltransferase [Nostoc sp. CmiVER01]